MTPETSAFDLKTLTLNVMADCRLADLRGGDAHGDWRLLFPEHFDSIYLKVRDALRPVVDAANAASDAYERGASDTLIGLNAAPAPAPPEPPLGDMAAIEAAAAALPDLPDAEAAAMSPTASLVRESPYFRFIQDVARCHTALHQMEESEP